MDNLDIKVKFFTKSNLIILGFIWGLFAIIIYLRKDTLYNNPSDIITIFAAFLAFTEILFFNYKLFPRPMINLSFHYYST